MNTPNYEIDPNNPKLLEVEAEKEAALTANGQTYNNMVDNSQQYYNEQIKAAQDYENKQTALQNEQTDFAIEKINQQKEQAKQDYTKEQSGAYVDWQKQSNQYGANAEAMASQGMTNTGYSESSQVSMYNTYQNRVATARESYNKAVQNYDNAITEARLQNNSVLAEIAYNSLQTQLQLSLEGFQYKNNLLIEQANKELDIKNTYNNLYLDVYSQIQRENELAEDVRQFGQKQIHDAQQAQLEREHDLALVEAKAEADSGSYQFGETPVKVTADGDVITPKSAEEWEAIAKGDDTGAGDEESSDVTVYDYFDALVKKGTPNSEIVTMLGAMRETGEITGTEYKKLLKKYGFNTAAWLTPKSGK